MTRARARDSADADLVYHRREWAIQRIGWLAMALFLLAAAAGLFGSGPLSRTQSGDPARGTIDYDRFARYRTETSLHICGPLSPGTPAEFHVGIPRDYVQSFAIRSVVPEPLGTRTSADGVEFEFDASTLRSCVEFRVEPTRIGRAGGPFTLGTAVLPVRQFVYP